MERLKELSLEPEESTQTGLARFHLAAIVNSSDDPIISKDLNGIITSWNRAATRMFGFEEEEIIGQPLLKIIPEELQFEEPEILRKIRAGQKIDHYETVRVSKSGRKIPVSVTISPITDDTGRIIGASKIVRDTSERQRADEARSRLAAIVESADDAIIGKGLDSIITSWNDAAKRMFGYAAEEMIGQSILLLIPEELQYEEVEILRQIRAGEKIDHYETTRSRKDGTHIEVAVTISPIKNRNGRVVGASKIVRDISDRKRIERLLIQSEKLAATGRMAAAIAHEINNPLESLVNLVFLALQDTPAAGKAHAYLRTAESELERLSHIARQTLGYYRETGKPTETYLHDIVQNVLTVYNARLIAAGIVIDARFNDLQKIRVKKGEMIQVISNLIGNSVDAMPHGGKLQVSTRNVKDSSGDGIQVVIRDQGVGIQQDNLEKIFEPFFTTKGELGTGIGLWVAKQLLESRGGQIAIASSSEPGNSGTTITLFIPFAEPAIRLPAAKESNLSQ